MNRILTSHKWLCAALAVLALASLLLAPFHHHDTGDDHLDCVFCRAVQSFFAVIGLLLVALVLPARSARLEAPRCISFFSRVFARSLASRAPPFA